MKNEMTKTVEQSNIVTPVQLLSIAVDKGADIDKLQQLMDLQQQWERNEAKKAYHQAVANFKTESINILKNKTVSFKNQDNSITSYNHATLDHIVEVAAPILAKHGLTHSWTPSQGEGGRITIKCTLTHASGHSEGVELAASPDDSGKKNNIQRVASTVTYLERYTFLAITGLAAKDQDDDGQASGEKEGFAEGLAYGMACYHLKEVIEEIKDRIADGDMHAAAEAATQLSNEDKMAIWRAPTKGGIFTTEERKIMKSDEFTNLVKEIMQHD